ncbi:MAG: (Fe-S)-binding protein [Thermoleophilia bacterium]
MRPEPLDSGLRLVESPPRTSHRTATSFAPQGLARAAEACNGNAACRARTGAMCPSFQALGDERHSTRGRAVLFRAALEGRLPGGLADDALHEALELCLACKACRTECPAAVDMAQLKTEALAHRHATRGVPIRTRLVGNTAGLLRLAGRAPTPLRRAGAWAAGRAVGRPLPVPTAPWRPRAVPAEDADVLIVADTFTHHLHPHVGDDALRVLEAAGARPGVVFAGCCGRPQLSAGLVAEARARVAAMLDRLGPHARRGAGLVLLEPSCWSMLADDAAHLVPAHPHLDAVREHLELFEQTVLRLGVPELAPDDRRGVTHPHCHAQALAVDHLGALMDAAGVAAAPSGGGCCGMAGSFGYLHPELSRDIAAIRLVPAATTADVVVAHGTSCRQQVDQLTPTPAVHPATYLARRLRATAPETAG